MRLFNGWHTAVRGRAVDVGAAAGATDALSAAAADGATNGHVH